MDLLVLRASDGRFDKEVLQKWKVFKNYGGTVTEMLWL